MTYWSRKALISFGFGALSIEPTVVPPLAGECSISATYSAASFAQSEQMYPSMPWSMNGTSASDRPQRTQRECEDEFFLAITGLS